MKARSLTLLSLLALGFLAGCTGDVTLDDEDYGSGNMSSSSFYGDENDEDLSGSGDMLDDFDDETDDTVL